MHDSPWRLKTQLRCQALHQPRPRLPPAHWQPLLGLHFAPRLVAGTSLGPSHGGLPASKAFEPETVPGAETGTVPRAVPDSRGVLEPEAGAEAVPRGGFETDSEPKDVLASKAA